MLDYVPGRSASTKPFGIDYSHNVAIRNCEFDGHLSGGYRSGIGLRGMRSSQITVENSDFAKFQRGAGFLDVTGLVVRGNDMSLMSEDVLTFAQVIGARIENNHLHDMQTPPERIHKDLIQFWSTNTTKPTADVVIRNNVLESDEPGVHGILVGNEIARSKPSFKYQNILIEDNKITSGHAIGIAVEHVNKLVIRDNDVRIHPEVAKTPINTPTIKVTPDSTNVTIAGNLTHGLPDKYGSGWIVSGNDVVSRYGQAVTAKQGSTAPSAPDGGAETSGGDDFRFFGSKIKSDKTVTLSGFDFEEDDRIILQDFAPGTLDGWGGGNPLAVNNAGTYAVIDSLADVAELSGASGAKVKAMASADTLVIDVNPSSGGSLELRLPGLGQEYLDL